MAMTAHNTTPTMSENKSDKGERATEPSSAQTATITETRREIVKRWYPALGLFLVFLLGFVPMFLQARDYAAERDMARAEMVRLRVETLAAASALDARRGEYESARKRASEFFSLLSTELDRGPASSLAAQLDKFRPLLTQRDDFITLLARSDPAAAERLTEVYLVCRNALLAP